MKHNRYISLMVLLNCDAVTEEDIMASVYRRGADSAERCRSYLGAVALKVSTTKYYASAKMNEKADIVHVTLILRLEGRLFRYVI